MTVIPPIKLLLVEDDEDDYTLVMDTISEIVSCSYDVTWVQEYEKALSLLKACEFDVCLFDFRLGARTGLELLREVRGFGCEVPVIFLTAQTEREFDIEAMKAGASDFLHKHTSDPAQIERAIRYAIERAHSLQTLRRLNEELRVARNQALKSSQAKSAFLANVSHELRTPLNAIIGYSELILDSFEDGLGEEPVVVSEVRDDVRRICGAGSHLLALISDVLDLNRIESGRFEISPASIELEAFVGHTFGSLGALVAANDNRLVTRFDLGEGTMTVDPTRLRQILINVVGNACKFTKEGEIEVFVARRPAVAADFERYSHRRRPPAVDFVEFRVQDSGIGMLPHQLGRLFKNFSQADETISRRFGGTGLGLAISRRLARLMGGDIRVESVYGEGSTFTIILPTDIRPFHRPRAAAPETLEGGPEPRDRMPHALLLGSNVGLLTDLQEALGGAGIDAVIETDLRGGTSSMTHLAAEHLVFEVDIADPTTLAALAQLADEPGRRESSITVFLLAESGLFGLTLESCGVLGTPLRQARLLELLEGRGGDLGPVTVRSNNEELREEIAGVIHRERPDLCGAPGDEAVDLFFVDLAASGVFSSYSFAAYQGSLSGEGGTTFLVAPADLRDAAAVEHESELRPLVEQYGVPRAQLLEGLCAAVARELAMVAEEPAELVEPSELALAEEL